jgi:hypothetical protein
MQGRNTQTLKELDDRCAPPPRGSCVKLARACTACGALTCVPFPMRGAVHSARSVSDAVANLGETEVREALLAKATFFVKIGDKARREASACRMTRRVSYCVA